MCPPGVDQTTRSSPIWTLLAPGLQQKQELLDSDGSQKYGGEPYSFISNRLSWDAVGKLVKVGASPKVCTRSPSPAVSCRAPALSSRLERLPAELLNMIDKDLSIPDKVALGLCSQPLWRRLLAELQRDYLAGVAPWAGSPIICTSTWLQDLPDPILDLCPDLRADTKSWNARIRSAGPGFRMRRGMVPARRWNWEVISDGADGSYRSAKDAALEPLYLEAFQKHSGHSGIPEMLLADLQTRLSRDDLISCGTLEAGTDWVLRNFTTKEAVYFKVTKGEDAKDATLAVDGLPWLTLDAVLLFRVQWAYEGRYTEHPSMQVKGDWAGHSFDVIDGPSLQIAEGWRDITDELVKEAKEVFPEEPRA